MTRTQAQRLLRHQLPVPVLLGIVMLVLIQRRKCRLPAQEPLDAIVLPPDNGAGPPA